jgi:hypothetical protein
MLNLRRNPPSALTIHPLTPPQSFHQQQQHRQQQPQYEFVESLLLIFLDLLIFENFPSDAYKVSRAYKF